MIPAAVPASDPTTSTACGTPGSLNVSRILADFVSPLLPGNLRPLVRNRPLPSPCEPGAGRRRPLVREAGALIDGACCEMIGWGGAIGFSRLLAVAEQVSPGLSFPWTTWQCFCALSDGARGNLLCALQGLPLGAVLPAALRHAVGQALQGVVPSGLGSVRGYQDLVIGVACCAVLYELARQRPVEAVGSAAGRALLHRLRQLRAVLNIAGGLQHPAVPTTTGDRALAAVPQPAVLRPIHCSRLGTWKGRDDEAQLRLPMSGSWLLPGALAKSGKGKAGPPGKPPPPKPVSGKGGRRPTLAKPASPVQRARPAKGVVAGVGAAAGGSGGGAESGAAAGSASASASAAASSSAGGAAAGDANKEVLFAVMPAKAEKPPTAPLFGGQASLRPPSPPSPSPSPGTAKVGRASHGGTVLHVSPMPTARLFPSCVRFHHVGEAARQVKKARFDVPTPRFCVHYRARPLFESQFDTATDPVARQDDWIVGLPIRERYANPLRQAEIRKYSGLGQLDRQAPQAPVVLGDDEIHVVASISVVPDHALQRHRPSVAQLLEPDTFRLLEHIQLDGLRRLFLAYVVRACAQAMPPVHAGLLEIEQGPHGLLIHDPGSGFTLQDDSLANLVIGIERVSGLRFHPDADALTAMDAEGDAVPVGLPASLSLFVRKEAMASASPCSAKTRLQRRSQFFEPITFGRPAAGHRLLRNCFSVVDAMIIAVDAEGLLHTLVFTPSDADAGVVRLNAQRGVGREFLRTLGLQPGQPCRLKEVGVVLRAHGLSEVRGDAAAHRSGSGFQVYRSDGATGQSVDPPAEQPAGLPPGQDVEVIEHPVPSTFRLHGDRIQYVDHEAGSGVLLLSRQGPAPFRWLLAADNPPAALLFARSNGIQPGMPYTPEELTWLLYGNGFVQQAH